MSGTHHLHRNGKTCFDALAEGWALLADMCPLCTADFIATAEVAAGRQLNWHPSFRQRMNATQNSEQRRP